jgi:hypothetical protein
MTWRRLRLGLLLVLTIGLPAGVWHASTMDLVILAGLPAGALWLSGTLSTSAIVSVLFVYSVLAWPVTTLLAMMLAWVLWRFRWERLALGMMLLPAAYFVVVETFFLAFQAASESTMMVP